MPASEDTSLASIASRSTLTTDAIIKISLLSEPVNRNLQITACYHELSAAFAKRTGIVSNWCTFATWASKQAGVTIRGEDLQRKLEEALTNEPDTQDMLRLIKDHSKKLAGGALQQSIAIAAVKKLAGSAKQRASESVARGNKKVFEEIGLQFARFFQRCIQDEQYQQSSIDDFCSQLLPGPPPDGQQHLSIAFRSYYKAFFEADTKTQDELVLLANIHIGFHEQTRLQPEIVESLDAANIDAQQLRNHLTDIIVKSKSLQGKLLYFFTWLIGGTRLFKNSIDALAGAAEKHIRKVITKHLMTLTLPPDTTLHLGDPLTQTYPESLKTISYADLQSMLKQLKPTADAIDGAGCTDWGDLKERVYFIANLFRCYHQTKDLFTAPFTVQQLSEIRTGKKPEGRL